MLPPKYKEYMGSKSKAEVAIPGHTGGERLQIATARHVEVKPNDRRPNPALPDAMPLPRLGCGGPTQLRSTSSHASQTIGSYDNNQSASRNASDLPNGACESGENHPSQGNSTAPGASPTLPDATPLPRLGCGGPAQEVEDEQDITSQVPPLHHPKDNKPAAPKQNEHQQHHHPVPERATKSRQVTVPGHSATEFSNPCDHEDDQACQFDPYLAGPDQDEKRTEDHNDFYDDPTFDQQVVHALNNHKFDQAHFDQGAVPGFAVKRSNQEGGGPSKRQCIRPDRSQDPAQVPSDGEQMPLQTARDEVPDIGSEQKHTGNHESTDEPPLPDAMPLPRLGCGGPARDVETPDDMHQDGKETPQQFHHASTQQDKTSEEEHTSSREKANAPIPPKITSSGPAAEAYHNTEAQPESKQEIQPDMTPALPDAKPPSRLGWGGPAPGTQVIDPSTAAQYQIQVQVIHEGGIASEVQLPEGSKASQLIALIEECTDRNIDHITDAIGRFIKHDTALHEGQTYIIQHQPGQINQEVPCLKGSTRAALLWQQGGYVAVDEMEYYLYMLECYQPTTIYGHLQLQNVPDHAKHTTLADYVIKVVGEAGTDPNSCVKAFVVHHDNHWSPCVATVHGPEIRLCLAPNDKKWMQPMIQTVLGDEIIKFQEHPMPTAFHADCGFQAIGWILSILLHEPTDVPFSGDQAIQWRHLFLKDLRHTGRDSELVMQPLCLGGTQSVVDRLQDLVITHGVAEPRGKECADQLIQALGMPAIQQILTSPKPWADLKARANLHKPPIRVVLADELKAMIQNKAGLPQVGAKINKTKPKVAKKTPLQLRADQLEIPHGVFKQTDGELLGQIQAAKIAPNSSGVALANIHEVLPFFDLKEPISQKGVALLILEHDDARLPNHCQVIKVPALCKDTKDPLIVKVAVIQLGSVAVTRNTPAQAIEVPEVPNTVVRVLVYKDQFQGTWQDFVRSPVRHLMKQPPFATLQPPDVIDVWDRQFMSSRLTRTGPEESMIFSVNLRIKQEVLEDIFTANGVNGMYIEPRTPDGRQPADQYQVVWLPRKTFSEAQVCQQTSKVPATLVRQCDRYGLRVESSKAEELHRIHRPDLVYIPGAELAKYRVGPMPFGTTKQSLVHVFSKWQWQARPLAPQGQARDRSGVMWLVQAAEPPTHWIFQLSHGDVLVSLEEKGTPVQEPSQAVLASSKTIQALQSKQLPASEDPWIHHDPWQATRPSTRELSTGQVTALETRIEQNLLHKLRPDDTEMQAPPDEKIQALEARLDQLSATVATNQQEVHMQHQTVQNQLKSLDMKVDQQQGFFQNTLESKLEQQMQRIEQLFGKRQRTNE